MYEHEGFRNLGNITEFLISGYKSTEAEDIPKERSKSRSIKKDLKQSYKKLVQLIDENPLQAALFIGGVILVMILSCSCIGYLIYKIFKKLKKVHQNENKLAQNENPGVLSEADKNKSSELVSDEIAQQLKKEQ